MERRKLKIGSVELENSLILGPMAGVTDMPFRMLCREQGCGAAYTEMVSAKAIFYNNKKTFELMEVGGDEGPVALQLFGSEPQLMADIAARMEEGPFAWIDVNMGCPVPKIVNNGEGSALMKDPGKVERILTAMVKKVKKPVTVKFRKSFDENYPDAVEFARIAEGCGAAAVAVHGRTRRQFYSGQADWDIIRRVKEAVKIPVIGSGDVFTPESVGRMFEETGCDGIMIARGARGNPWIFSRTLHYLETGQAPPAPDKTEIRSMMLRHAGLLAECKGEYAAVKELRKHIGWYTGGLPHSAALRNDVNQAETLPQLEKLIWDSMS